jgi:hypothetical protein
MSTFLIIFLILLVIAWYLSFSASRLDRLHHRVETSWEHLDALLQRRSALALEISHASDLDPATKLLLTESAYVSREESIIERNDAERSLSQSLRFLKSAASQGDLHINYALLEELTTLTEKITIAIAIHLEAVNTVSRVRSRLLYRIFHLAGSAKLPHTYSFEDESL